MNGIRKQRANESYQKVLSVMSNEWMLARDIGVALGYSTDKAARNVGKILKKLLVQNKVEMSLARGYRLKK